MRKVNQEKECSKCGKTVTMAYNRPKSLHKTKRKVKPNLQMQKNKLVCTRCIKSN